MKKGNTIGFLIERVTPYFFNVVGFILALTGDNIITTAIALFFLVIGIIVIVVQIFIYNSKRIKSMYKTHSEDVYGKMEDITRSFLGATSRKMLPEKTIDLLKNVCDDFSDFLKVSFDKKYCVTIKKIDTKSKGTLQSREVYTLCRCHNAFRDRNKKNTIKHTIERNTDFNQIVIEKQPFFACWSLKEFKENNNEYNNTNSEYQKHYDFVVVFPIIDNYNELLNDKDAETEIKGFFCVDSLSYKKYKELDDIIESEIGSIMTYCKIMATIIFLIMKEHPYEKGG
jgi:hypothetical protein